MLAMPEALGIPLRCSKVLQRWLTMKDGNMKRREQKIVRREAFTTVVTAFTRHPDSRGANRDTAIPSRVFDRPHDPQRTFARQELTNPGSRWLRFSSETLTSYIRHVLAFHATVENISLIHSALR